MLLDGLDKSSHQTGLIDYRRLQLTVEEAADAAVREVAATGGTLSSHFIAVPEDELSQEQIEDTMREFRRNIRICMKERGGLTLRHIFRLMDKDGDGALNELEFAQAVKEFASTIDTSNP